MKAAEPAEPWVRQRYGEVWHRTAEPPPLIGVWGLGRARGRTKSRFGKIGGPASQGRGAVAKFVEVTADPGNADNGGETTMGGRVMHQRVRNNVSRTNNTPRWLFECPCDQCQGYATDDIAAHIPHGGGSLSR